MNDFAYPFNFRRYESYIEKADFFKVKKQYGLQLKVLEKAKELTMSDGYISNEIGYCLIKFGREEEAIQYFSKAVALNPDNAMPLYGLAQLYISKREFALAAAYFKQAIKLEPLPDFFLYYALSLKGANSHQEALQQVKFFQELNGVSHSSLLLEVKCLLSLDKLEESLTTINNGIKITPSHPEVQSLKGFILLEMKRMDESLKSYRDAIFLYDQAKNKRDLDEKEELDYKNCLTIVSLWSKKIE